MAERGNLVGKMKSGIQSIVILISIGILLSGCIENDGEKGGEEKGGTDRYYQYSVMINSSIYEIYDIIVPIPQNRNNDLINIQNRSLMDPSVIDMRIIETDYGYGLNITCEGNVSIIFNGTDNYFDSFSMENERHEHNVFLNSLFNLTYSLNIEYQGGLSYYIYDNDEFEWISGCDSYGMINGSVVNGWNILHGGIDTDAFD